MKNQQNRPLLRKQPIFMLSLAVFILIISGGYFYYRNAEKTIRQEKHNYLKTIADLKTSQIVNWREERLADADVFIETFIRQTFQQWLYSQDSTLKNELLDRFSLLRYYYKYEDVSIVSSEGILLFGLDTNLKYIDSEISDNCKKALLEKKTFLGDLYFCPAHDTVHLDVFAPILNNKNVPVAVLVLRVNPFDFLYPLFQSWPTPSKSAETFIIRKEGDSILYVNELRHISNTALKLRIPLTSIEVPAVQAALGSTGIIEGPDYRGVRVLADMRQVPGSPWFMIAKIDQSEIFSELKYRTVIIIIITLLLLLSSGIGISWVYNNRQINIYRKLTETGTALREEKDRIRTILDMVGDPIFVKDNDHRIILANRAFYDIFCLDEKSVIGFTLAEAVPENERQHFLEVDRRVLDTGISDISEEELTVRNHTLTVITKKKCFTDESGKRFLVGSMHDITERKQAVEALKLSEAKYRQLVINTDIGFVVVDDKGNVVEANDPYLKMAGYGSFEEISGRSVLEWTAPDEVENNAANIALCAKQGYVQNFETVYLRADGTRINIILDATIQSLPDGKMQIVAFCRNITQRKQAENKILNQLDELQRWNNITLGREDRNRELKQEVNELLVRLGESIRYSSQEINNIIEKPPIAE